MATGPLTTFRIPPALKEQLEAVAQCDGVPLAEEIRQAISDRIERKRRDPEFQARLKEVMEKNRQRLGWLSDR